MSKHIQKSTRTSHQYYEGKHRFEHWYVNNQVYFITARVRDRLPAFESEHAKTIFWDRFDHYTTEAAFVPWVTSLLDNHYHTLGYCREGAKLKTMMQRLHGSVAKLVNDLLEAQFMGPEGSETTGTSGGFVDSGDSGDSGGSGGASCLSGTRLTRFWRDAKGREYFDGCIRDKKQCRLAYRYTLTQSHRHGICSDWRSYPHTHVHIALEPAITRARHLNALLESVPYKRYLPSRNR